MSSLQTYTELNIHKIHKRMQFAREDTKLSLLAIPPCPLHLHACVDRPVCLCSSWPPQALSWLGHRLALRGCNTCTQVCSIGCCSLACIGMVMETFFMPDRHCSSRDQSGTKHWACHCCLWNVVHAFNKSYSTLNHEFSFCCSAEVQQEPRRRH